MSENSRPYLQKIQKKFDDPLIRGAFVGYTRTFLFEFTDINESYTMHIINGDTATLEKGATGLADLTVTTTSEVLVAVGDKKLNPMIAYSTRQVRVKGSMEDLLKLQKLV